jgi:hypothetical protein
MRDILLEVRRFQWEGFNEAVEMGFGLRSTRIVDVKDYCRKATTAKVKDTF